MLILALDTSGKTASCALARDGMILAEKKQLSKLSHSRTILPMCEEMLREQGLGLSDADLFAVTEGPGSFTGVRIGIAAAKGFAFPSGTPCAGVTAMRSAAFASGIKNGMICSAIRAREDEYYCAFFAAKDGVIEQLTENEICSGAAIAEKAASFGAGKIYLCGEGSEALLTAYPFADTGAAQSAAGTALAAFSEKPVSFHELQPLYMKPSQAERLKKEKN